jgi:hypothetical protein
MIMFQFKCASCEEWHEGMPSFGTNAPSLYNSIPAPERDERCHLTSDICIVDDEFFFVHGCIEIPVIGAAEPFIWGAWVSLSAKNFGEFIATFDAPNRSDFGPYFGWLSTELPVYPSTQNLKAHLYIRDHGMRPLIELEPTDYPLAVEQRQGITVGRLSEIYAACMHGRSVKH